MASFLVVSLCVALVPFATPAAAAEVGIAAVGTADLRAVSFIDASTGLAVASDGQIWRTVNGGSTWTSERAADAYQFVGIDFWNATNGVAVDASGKVASTTNGGDTWANVVFPGGGDMDQNFTLAHGKVACVPGSTTAAIAASGDPNPDHTAPHIGAMPLINNGTLAYWGSLNNIEQKPHWDRDAFGGLTAIGEALLFDVDFANGAIGVTAGVDYYALDADNPNKYPLYTTADGGTYWTPRSFGTTDASLNGVALGSTTSGIAVGTAVADGTARAFRTNGTLATWVAATTLPTTNALHGADMSSATQGWAVGAAGTIIRTVDGGANWTACTVPVGFSSTLYDVEFIEGTTQGWAVGAAGAALRTVDGINWTAMPGAIANPGPTMGAITSATHPVAATWYSDNDPAFAWTATDSDGVAGYSLVLDTAASTIPDTAQDQTVSTKSYTNQPDGRYYLHVRPVDGSGVWGDTAHREVRIDTTPPTGTISIKSGAADTNTRNVTLTLGATDAGSGMAAGEMRLSNDGSFDTVVWEAYATSKAWTLLAGDGTKTVHVQFRDALDQASGSFSDTIEYTAPVGNVAPVADADSYTMAEDTVLTVAAPGVLLGDTDTNGDTLTTDRTGATGPSHGTLQLNADGSFTYTPTANFFGTDTFTYRASDGVEYSGYATVTITVTDSPETVKYVPLAGGDRYSTAVAVSASTFPSGANAVIIATGLNYPDALASAGLAGVVGAPVLLVHGSERGLARDGLAIAEADRVLSGKSPKTLYIIGGPSAVTSGIESALKSRYGASNVVRLGGADRYATANVVATRMKSEMTARSMPWTGDAFIVPGMDFRDALVVGPESYAAHRPILLYDVRGTGGLTASCSALGVTRGQVSGATSGAAGVPTNLAISGVTLSRISSAGSAPARSVQIADWAAANLAGIGWSWRYAGIATADLYPDGLSAAPRQGIDRGPLLLTPSTALDASVAGALTAHRTQIVEVRYFGGPVAIPEKVRTSVDALLP